MTGLRVVGREFVRMRARLGWWTAFVLLPTTAWRCLRGAVVSVDPGWDPEGAAFDHRYGVDTCGLTRLSRLRVSVPNWVHGLDYQPVRPHEMAAMLDDIDIDTTRATFVDIGAGKGRAMMLAARLPFKKIVGVEFSDELVAVARRNFQLFAAREPVRAALEVVCADAATYVFPNGPLVVFMYNPFGAAVMHEVTANLAASLRARPRRAVVIYLRPELAAIWDGVDGLGVVKATPRYRVYDTVAGDRATFHDRTPPLSN